MDIKKPKIAFFGTGLMGTPMAARLLDAGYELAAYNRTASKTEPLKEKGATVAQKPEDAARSADVLITMLADFHATADVLSDIPPEVLKDKTLIQMGTISSDQSLQIKKQMDAAGCDYLEAPVLGSIPAATDGTLFVLVGGTQHQFDTWDKLLSHIGDKRYFMGEVGKAAAVKLAFNHLTVAIMAGFSMSLGLVREKGVDVDLFMTILRQTAMYTQNYDKKLDFMLQRDFSDTNFPVRLLLKDTNLMLEEFRKAGINTLPLEGTRDVIHQTVEHGEGDLDYSAIYDTIHPK